jgi:hypothetical protein
MGVSESKTAHAGYEKWQATLCCVQNGKDVNKKRRVPNSAGREKSVETPGSFLKFTPWITQPEQMDANYAAAPEISLKSQNSFRRDSLSGSNPNATHSELPDGWTGAQISHLKDAVHRTASLLKYKSPGFYILQVTRSSSYSHSVHTSSVCFLCTSKLITHDVQSLQRARTSAAPGKLLSSAAADGLYGDRFWAQVASGVPGRTAAECLDAYLAAYGSPIARFSAPGARVSAAKATVV